MSIVTADLGGQNFVLGKGRVFFDRFANGIAVSAATQGEGERYFGNSPEFNMSSSSENVDHFSSESGLKVKDDSVQLSVNRSGKITVDNMSDANLALWFLGTSATLAQTAQVGLTTLQAAAKRGTFVQLGATSSLPGGVRKVLNVVVKKGAGYVTTVAAAGNYQVDSDLGRVYIEATAPDINDEDIQITFDTAVSSRIQVVSGANSIYGAMRFISDVARGLHRDIYMPYVKLAPDGDYQLKGDSYQQVGFNFEILKKASNIESAYIDGRPA